MLAETVDDRGNVVEKLGISCRTLDPPGGLDQHGCSSESRSPPGFRGRSEDRSQTGPQDRTGSDGKAVGDRLGGPGTGREAERRNGPGARRRLSDTICDGRSRAAGAWPRGARAVSTVRLLGAASRPGSTIRDCTATHRSANLGRMRARPPEPGDRRPPPLPRSPCRQWRWGTAVGAVSMAHGSTSTSAHGSHSSSSVLWAIP